MTLNIYYILFYSIFIDFYFNIIIMTAEKGEAIKEKGLIYFLRNKS